MNDPPSEHAIDLRQVTKVYRGRIHALQGIEMRVRRGEVFGLLGPNGAGKSTLVKIMMTVIRPTRADGTVLGRPVGHKPTLARVGYLPENHRYPRYLTGRKTLEFFAALAKVDRRTRKRRAEQMLEVIGMREAADRSINGYSKGMMQRIGLGQALMNDPDLIVLDEPTDGVDPAGRRDIRNVLARLREQGKTVFLNSHLLSELELICDHVAILVAGRVARQGTMDQLTLAKQRYEVELSTGAAPLRTGVLEALPECFNGQASQATVSAIAPLPLPGMAPVLPAALPRTLDKGALPTGQWIELEGSVLRLGTTEAADVQPVLDALRRTGLTIRRVQQVRPSLEDLFLETISAPAAPADGFPIAPPPGVR